MSSLYAITHHVFILLQVVVDVEPVRYYSSCLHQVVVDVEPVRYYSSCLHSEVAAGATILYIYDQMTFDFLFF
jgi:hypothetical protein